MKELLKIKDFTFLLLSSAVSLIGDKIYFIALIWYVYDITKSTLSVSILMIMNVIPVLLFSLLGGSFADKYDKKKIMVFLDLVNFGIMLTASLLLFYGELTLIRIYVIMFALSSVSQVYGPSKFSAIPKIVRDKVLKANSLASSILTMIGFTAYLIGGILVKTLGYFLAFFIDSLTFFVSALLLIMIRTSLKGGAQEKNIIAEIKGGLKFVKTHKFFIYSILFAFLCSVAISGIVVILPAYVDSIGKDAAYYSMLLALNSLGYIFGALIIGRVGLSFRNYLLSFILMSLAFILLGYPICIFIPLFAILTEGIGTALNNIIVSTMIQKKTGEYTARVFSLSSLLVSLSAPIGFFIAPILTSFLEITETILLLSSLPLICVLGIIILRTTFGRYLNEENTPHDEC